MEDVAFVAIGQGALQAYHTPAVQRYLLDYIKEKVIAIFELLSTANTYNLGLQSHLAHELLQPCE